MSGSAGDANKDSAFALQDPYDDWVSTLNAAGTPPVVARHEVSQVSQPTINDYSAVMEEFVHDEVPEPESAAHQLSSTMQPASVEASAAGVDSEITAGSDSHHAPRQLQNHEDRSLLEEETHSINIPNDLQQTYEVVTDKIMAPRVEAATMVQEQSHHLPRAHPAHSEHFQSVEDRHDLDAIEGFVPALSDEAVLRQGDREPIDILNHIDAHEREFSPRGDRGSTAEQGVNLQVDTPGDRNQLYNHERHQATDQDQDEVESDISHHETDSLPVAETQYASTRERSGVDNGDPMDIPSASDALSTNHFNLGATEPGRGESLYNAHADIRGQSIPDTDIVESVSMEDIQTEDSVDQPWTETNLEKPLSSVDPTNMEAVNRVEPATNIESQSFTSKGEHADIFVSSHVEEAIFKVSDGVLSQGAVEDHWEEENGSQYAATRIDDLFMTSQSRNSTSERPCAANSGIMIQDDWEKDLTSPSEQAEPQLSSHSQDASASHRQVVATEHSAAQTTEDTNFFENDDSEWDIAHVKEIQQPTEHPSQVFDVPGSQGLESDGDGKAEENLENIWAQALGPPEEGLDDSWNAAFAEGFDDDGFLDDESMELSSQHIVPTPPSSSTSTTQAFQTYSAPSMVRAYTADQAVALSETSQPKASQPKEFFAELPSTQQVRSRKPKQQLFSITQPPGPAPPSRPIPPPRTSSAAAINQPPYSQFRTPERLDLFPPQSSLPTIPTPPSTLPQAHAPTQRTSPFAARYSPVLSPPVTAASLSSKPPSPANSRYPPSSTSQLYAPNIAGPGVASGGHGRVKSPYTPASATDLSRTSSYSKQLPPQTPPVPLPQPPLHTETRPTAPPRAPSKYAPHANTQGPSPNQLKQPPGFAALRDNTREMPPPSGPLLPPINRFQPSKPSPLAQLGHRPKMERTSTLPLNRQEVPPELLHSKRHSLGDTTERQSPLNSATPSADYFVSQSTEIPPPPSGQQNFQLPPKPTRAYEPTTQGRYNQVAPQRSADPPRFVERSVSYAPQSLPASIADTAPASPPRRPRTSSPTVIRSNPVTSKDVMERPSSVQVPAVVPIRTSNQDRLPPKQDFLDFVLPTNETAMDPLQRWKGHAIFNWSCGGSVATSFPKHIPRYGGGQAAPKMKCVPGEVKLQKFKDIVPGTEVLSSFPGPLKSKNKKKDVLAWLASRLDAFERDRTTFRPTGADDAGAQRREDEKTLLYQTLKLMVEHDGVLAGSAAVELAVRRTLFPGLEQASNATKAATSTPAKVPPAGQPNVDNAAVIDELRRSLLRGDRENAIWHAVDNRLWGHAMLMSSTIDPKIWKQVAQEFVRKEMRSSHDENRSLAALYEVFAGNWDESIDQLVPLSARAGFHMVSTAERPSQSSDALQGLNEWHETLGLILSNRSNGDDQALLALGKLLSSYGRTEAAHICYLFSRSAALFGGADDTQAHFTILGVDLALQGSDPGLDIDAILISEVYEFALSLSSSSSSQYIPHLQAYKLHHAYALAEIGLRSEASQYCEAITAAMKSTTRLSPYYHGPLATQLDDLSKRLSQSPKDGSSGWMRKPTIEKVGGSLMRMLNGFVVGDETDNASTGSHSDSETGHFARLPGGTPPTISRSNSSGDLYNYDSLAANGSVSRYAPTAYSADPGRPQLNSYSSALYGSSLDQAHKTDRRISYEASLATSGYPQAAPPLHRGMSQLSRYQSHEMQSQGMSDPARLQSAALYDSYPSTIAEANPPTYHEYPPPPMENIVGQRRGSSYAPSPLGIFETNSTDENHSPPQGGSSGNDATVNDYPQHSSSYDHSRVYSPSPAVNESGVSSYQQTESYMPSTNADEIAALNYAASTSSFGYPTVAHDTRADTQPVPASRDEQTNTGYDPSSGGYGSSSGGYGQSAGGYEPPSYQPYVPDTPQDDEAEVPKRRPIMDDDDDDGLAAKAAALKASQDPPSTREPDDAVRRAAEADAARDAKAASEKKSGSWLPRLWGKKDASAAAAPQVHKAKLGEDLSFYFDPETKKWVNGKAGAAADASGAATAPAATPPPPRAGPPSRSGMPQPASGPATPPVGRPPSGANYAGAAAALPRMEPSGSGSRAESPATTLLPSGGGAGGLQGGPPSATNLPLPGSGPPSRPATSMGNVSDIDDLLGPSGGVRKGGTLKKGKKGQRYVDVMAK